MSDKLDVALSNINKRFRSVYDLWYYLRLKCKFTWLVRSFRLVFLSVYGYRQNSNTAPGRS